MDTFMFNLMNGLFDLVGAILGTVGVLTLTFFFLKEISDLIKRKN